MSSVGRLAAIILLSCATTAYADLGADVVVFDGKQRLVDKGFVVLADPAGKLTLAQVSSPEFADRFLPASAFDGKVGEAAVYWIRVTVANRQADPVELALTPRGVWDEIELHASVLAEPRRTGHAVPASQRDIHLTRGAQDGGFFVAVTAPVPASAQVSLYLRIASDWQRYDPPSGLYLELNDLSRLRAEERQERPIQALFAGMLLALAAYHLLLLAALRDAGYGYYVVHILGIGLLGVSFFGLTFEYLLPEYPRVAFEAIAVWRAMATAGLALFVRVYLDTPRQQPRLDVALRLAAALALIAAVPLPFVSKPLANWLATQLMLVCLVLGFVTGIIALRKGSALARYFLAGNAFTVAGFLVTVGDELGVLSWLPWAGYGAPVGVTLEALMLSRGLAFRFSLMRAEIEKRERSEVLLRNMLPAAIAEELRRDGRSPPRRLDNVSILFTDFVGFTQTVSTLPPEKTVAELNEMFQAFDSIVERHGIEKIKTIGDAYMAAAGVPDAMADHAVRAVRAGLEMQRWLAERNQGASIKWALRLGIHSGSVVAGVVGRTKYAYDIWGDTVNVASRMESSGESGKVNVSAYTYDLIRDAFQCTYRGKVAAKGKGEIDMYFVEAEKGGVAGSG